MNAWKILVRSLQIGLGLSALVVLASGSVFPARALARTAPRPSLQNENARPAAVPLGVVTVLGIDDGGVISDKPEAQQLAGAVGVKWVRTAVSWAAIEPTQGVYDFTSSDKTLNNLLNAGLSPIVYVADNPAWAANTACGPIDTKDAGKLDSFKNLLSALAARYPTIEAWSLYNEVDEMFVRVDNRYGGCFGDPSKGGVNKNKVRDYVEYAILLKTAWEAIHTANPSPNVKLLMGSMAYDSFAPKDCPPLYPGGCVGGAFYYKFAPNLFAYMKKHKLTTGKYMDGVTFNYYDIYGRYWEKYAPGHGIQAKTNIMRQLIKSAGIPVAPLYVTETGNNSYYLGLPGQARCLEIMMVRGITAKLKGVVWWTFRDYLDSSPPPSNTNKYGIVDQNLQPKPSYTTLQTLATELNGFKFKKSFSGTPGFADVEAYRFKNGKQLKFVVWSSKIQTASPAPECSWARATRVATFNATKLRVVTFLNKVKNVKDNAKKDLDKRPGIIAINVTGSALIVEINPQ